MAAQIEYDACLEVYPNGECVAQLSDLPACFARAADEVQALATLESSIPAYFEWLARHDEYMPVMHGPFRAVVAEALPAPGAFFRSDALPLAADDLDWYTTLLDWSYQDFAARLAAADNGSDSRVLRLCETQVWLLSRLEQVTSSSAITLPQVSQGDLLALVHRAALGRVRAANGEERGRVSDLEGERWSLRKVLRRSILLVREGTLRVG